LFRGSVVWCFAVVPEVLRIMQNCPAELPVMRRVSGIRPGFRVNFFPSEDFVYLYDELFSPGKKSS
jgi:hypothetical protein